MERLLKAGIRAAQAGRMDEATKMLTRVVQKDPRSVEGWFWLGMMMPNDAQKIDCFRRVMKYDPDHFEARDELVQLGYLKPEPPQAEAVPAFSFDEPEEESAFSFDEPEEERLPIFGAVASEEKDDVPSFSFDEPEEVPPVFSFDEPEAEEEALADFGQELPPAPLFATEPEEINLAFGEKSAATPVATSPFAGGMGEDSFNNYYEDVEEPKEETEPSLGELDFMGDVDEDEGAEEKPANASSKVRKIALAILGVLAFLAVGGVVTIFVSQPTLVSDIASAIIPPTATATMPPTATPTMVPTPTPLPFSELETQAYAPVFEPSECSFETPPGQRVDCGYVIVPENRYGDVSKTIRLAVAVYRGSDYAAFPIVYLQGGPGQATVELMSENFDWSISSFVGKQDFILLDQRGMGLSEPKLDCPNVDEVYEAEASGEVPAEEKEARYLAAFTECRDKLVADGANLSSYNTMENAADVKDVVIALGYEKATLFGVSYGTRLAQVVMRENPEVVYSALLDSVLPIDAKVYNESSAVAQTSLDTLYAGCEIDEECRQSYPDLEGDLQEIVDRLDAVPLETNIFGYRENDYSRSVNGVDFMSSVLWAMRVPDLLDILPQAIGRANEGETNVLSFILSLPVGAVSDIDTGAYLSINCREQVYASTPKEVSEDLASYPNTEAVGLSWVYGEPNFIFDLCDTWQVEGIRPGENEAVSSDIPTLLMAGEYDSTTPPFWAEQVAENLSNATYIEFPAQGHGVAFSQDSTCPQEIAKSFFSDPAAALDTSCSIAMPSPDFSTPYMGEPPIIMIPVVSEEAGVITTAPADWITSEDSPGTYSREASLWDMTSISALKVGLDFDSVMNALVGDYEGIGLDSYPMQVDEIVANGLNWKLYETTLIGLPIDFAFARDGYDAILVIFLSHSDEHDILYKEVFMEVLNTTSVIPTDR